MDARDFFLRNYTCATNDAKKEGEKSMCNENKLGCIIMSFQFCPVPLFMVLIVAATEENSWNRITGH